MDRTGNVSEDAVLKFVELGVCRELAEAAAGLGWKEPMPIQTASIPKLLTGQDVIGLAQTGSGKTGAFALPILQDLLNEQKSFFALILAPTRELAVQISEQFEALGSRIGVRCAVLVGGVDMMHQAVALGKRPHIITGTPGRIVDHLCNTKGFSLRTVKHLVLDEADKLLDMDFEEEIDQILRAVPKERRTQLFSATMTAKVNKLKRAALTHPTKVEISTKYSTVDTLKQQYMFIPAKHKECYLAFLLNELSGMSIIVLLNTQGFA